MIREKIVIEKYITVTLHESRKKAFKEMEFSLFLLFTWLLHCNVFLLVYSFVSIVFLNFTLIYKI